MEKKEKVARGEEGDRREFLEWQWCRHEGETTVLVRRRGGMGAAGQWRGGLGHGFVGERVKKREPGP